MNEDAYHVLLRHFIGAQITNKLEWPHRLQIISDHEELVWREWKPFYRFMHTDARRPVNICGVAVRTVSDWDDGNFGCEVHVIHHAAPFTVRERLYGNELLARAAEANGIDADKSWSESQLWKALMSV